MHTRALRIGVLLSLGLSGRAGAFDSEPLEQCVTPFYQKRLQPEAAYPQCIAALRSASPPDRYWLQDKTYARWRVKAGRVVWLSLGSLLQHGKRPDEHEFSWFVEEMRKIAESRAMSRKYTSRAWLVVGGIKGLTAKYYRSGMGKKEIGKESFNAIRTATQVDPEAQEYWNLEAWIAYGVALVEICESSMARMAAYVLGIDRKAEVERTIQALGKLPDWGQSRHVKGRLQQVLQGL